MTLLILLVPLALLWFLVMRPAQKRQRQAVDMRDSLKPGLDIVTVSGMLGTILEVTDDDILVSIAPGVEVRMLKGAVGQVRPLPESDEDEDADTGENADLGADGEPAQAEPATASDGTEASDGPDPAADEAGPSTS